MGFFSEIKKLIFSVKSVSKSSTDKLVQKGKKTGEDLIDKGSDMVGRMRENVEEIGDDVMDFTEKVGEDAIEKGTRFVEKAKEIAEDVGSRVLGKETESSADHPEEKKMSADDLFDADFKDETEAFDPGNDPLQQGEDLDELVPEQGPKPSGSEEEPGIIQQARAAIEKVGNDLEEAANEIKELEKEELVNKPLSESMKKGSLEDKDDFFTRAKEFADGKYNKRRDVSEEPGKPTIQEKGKEKQVDKETGFVPGFDDLDGDGDEIIDDAFILSEEE